MQLINIEKSLGLIRTVSDKTTIPYEAFEFSAHLVGILSTHDLSLNDEVILESHRNGNLKFRIIMKEDTGRCFRYRLRSLEKSVNLSDRLDIDPFTGKIRYDRRDNRLQYARFEAERPIQVKTKLFGSFRYHNLETIDISRSGALLCAPRPRGLIPFREDTLLELSLHLSEIQRLNPLAKVVRRFTRGQGEAKERYYGVRFVEFSEAELKTWSEVITEIEQQTYSFNQVKQAA